MPGQMTAMTPITTASTPRQASVDLGLMVTWTDTRPAIA
jgi:hypothetical protein